MGLVEKIISNSIGHIFQKCGYDKCHIQILRPSYLKIIFQCLRFLDHIQENMFGSDTNIVWTDQAFHGCKDSSIR